jgi:transposase
MLGNISSVEHIYLVTGYTDMRRSIDGLCVIIEDQLRMNPYTNSRFLFCGKRRERINAIA